MVAVPGGTRQLGGMETLPSCWSPLLCTFTSAAVALHSLSASRRGGTAPARPCSLGSLKRLLQCPLDSCNTGAHVFKKPGPGDIPWACCWLSFPGSHSPPQEGCKFGRSCIISRPTLSHVSPATSLSVTPSCRPHRLPPPHLPLLLPAAHSAGFLGRARTLSWHRNAWKCICGQPCMPSTQTCTVTHECRGLCTVCPCMKSGCLEALTVQGLWLHVVLGSSEASVLACFVSPTAIMET